MYCFTNLSEQKYNNTDIVTVMISSKLYFLTLLALLFLSANFIESAVARAYCLYRADADWAFPAGPVQNSCPVVINEIMVDPTPIIGLPDAEWIELLNISKCTLSLAGWKLVVGSVTRNLPEAPLDPGQYIIICSIQASSELQKWGKTVSLASFPALRNTGNRIELFDQGGLLVDAVDYSDSWYHDKVKKNGGWSLEKIDPQRNCGQNENWTACKDPGGGTPGTINSVYTENKDTQNPMVLSARCLSATTVTILFSEPMDTFLLLDPQHYNLSDGWGHPGKLTISADSLALLSWSIPLTENETFNLHIDGLADLCGNVLATHSLEIQWITLEPGDVVINEILFNPWPEGDDFVEIYNHSLKFVGTGKLMLASRDETDRIKSQVSLIKAGMVIPPGGYLALTSDSNGVLPLYFTPCRKCIRQITSLPAFNNDKGCVVLMSDSLKILDEFSYSEKMHHSLLYNVEGVSLERINPGVPANQPGNWQSASSTVGFATPGYQNSQFQPTPVKRTTVNFDQAAFSPNGDGFNDEMLINYELQAPGWVANCHIFDTAGRPVFQLLNNALLQVSGTIRWDGKDETGKRLPYGPYIVMLELFDLDGNIERYKKAVVLTERGE